MTAAVDPPSRQEWLAVAISRLVRDGDRVSVGTNLPAPRAGALLAKRTHAPNAVLYLGMAEVRGLPPGPLALESLAGAAAGAIAHHRLEDFFARANQVDFFVVGALQIDRHGNTNLLGVGPSGEPLETRYRHRTVIGPGTIGTATMTTYAGRYALFCPDHQPRTFVPQLAFRSTCGWGTDGQERTRLDLPGGGPGGCVTDLGLFGYPAPDRSMALIAPFPGVTFEEIAGRTGFDVARPSKLQEFGRPSPEV
ncbi:MAG TPA: CoA-transferase, partial [bacterium]|nr:CoA-transferase [bacterium]